MACAEYSNLLNLSWKLRPHYQAKHIWLEALNNNQHLVNNLLFTSSLVFLLDFFIAANSNWNSLTPKVINLQNYYNGSKFTVRSESEWLQRLWRIVVVILVSTGISNYWIERWSQIFLSVVCYKLELVSDSYP